MPGLLSLRNSFLTLCFLVSLSSFNSAGQNTFDWPCFHGPSRTNKSTETGMIKKWPKDGPELLWTVSGLNEGYSSISVGGGLLYTAGMSNNQTYVFSFDLEGKAVWKKPNGKAWSTTLSYASSYTGARSTPTYDNGILYHLGERGTMKLVRATPDKFELSGEYKVPNGGEGMYWAHPVVCGGSRYIRHADKLYAYNIGGK